MDLKLKLQDRVLVAELTGRMTLREAVKASMLACSGAAERNCSAILLDASAVVGELSIYERHELGRTVADYCMLRGWSYKLAVVGSPPAVTGVGALVASNRGLVTQRFSDRQEALEWLNATARGFSRAQGNHAP
jgi:hypothetical protein